MIYKKSYHLEDGERNLLDRKPFCYSPYTLMSTLLFDLHIFVQELLKRQSTYSVVIYALSFLTGREQRERTPYSDDQTYDALAIG